MNSNRVSPTNAIGPLCLAILLFSALAAGAQTTEFTYQGKLNDGMTPATGSYDFIVSLYSVETGGTPIASLSRPNIAVTNGIFALRLDFGAQFPGSNRWLEISLRPAGTGTFQALSPRVQVNSAPYSIKSAIAENAFQLGGIAADQFVLTNDPRMSNARTPLAGSTNYIQNSAFIQNANFSITGNMSANIVSAAQFNYGGFRLIGIGPGSNTLFVGLNAGGPGGVDNSYFGTNTGNANSLGAANSFFGSSAGRVNTTGSNNSFFGMRAGDINTTGSHNSYFGRHSGLLNLAGAFNSFFGSGAGENSTTSNNSFFGYRAGATNSNASGNSFFGYLAGEANTGDENAFFGSEAGKANWQGDRNSFFGYAAGDLNTNGSSNSYFGFRAGSSNTLGEHNSFFGALAGRNNTGSDNSFFGYEAGASNSGINNSFFGYFAGLTNTTGSQNAFFGKVAGRVNTTGLNNSFFGYAAGVSNTTGSTNSFFGTGSGASNTVGSNNTFLGYQAGYGNTDGLYNTYAGYEAGQMTTTGNANTFYGYQAGKANTVGDANTVIGWNANTSGIVSHATAIGAEAVVSTSNTIVLGRNFANPSGSLGDDVVVYGFLRATLSPTGGSIDVCQNAATFNLSSCSSSLRYKSNVESYDRGLEVVRRLRPIAFKWNSGGALDIGFAAEEVASVEPALATQNAKGEIEGVKYKQITTVLVNAVKQQQAEIDSLREQLTELKKIVCAAKTSAEICKGISEP